MSITSRAFPLPLLAGLGLLLAADLSGLSPLADTAAAAEASPVHSAEWRFALGAEINPISHGIGDLAWRRGPLSVSLLTDTLELRYAPEFDHGRAWGAARAEAGAAGLMISPWKDGAPDPSSALMASYAGIEGGGVRYLPRGFYAGGQGVARVYAFSASGETTTIPIPEKTPFATGELLGGYYSKPLAGWARAGVDLEGDQLSPHVHANLRYHQAFGGGLESRIQLYAGLAEGQGIIARTRLGGLNPYVVPLAGAGWAEWWVEDYLAAHVGLGYRAKAYDLEVFAEGAAFDGKEALGTGVKARYFRGPWFVDGAFGYAPKIERQPGVGRSSVYVLLGREWAGRKR